MNTNTNRPTPAQKPVTPASAPTPPNPNPTEEKSFGDKVGGMVEKLGHKIADAGMPGVGKAIHDAGDKMESHHSNPSHPHEV